MQDWLVGHSVNSSCSTVVSATQLYIEEDRQFSNAKHIWTFRLPWTWCSSWCLYAVSSLSVALNSMGVFNFNVCMQDSFSVATDQFRVLHVLWPAICQPLGMSWQVGGHNILCSLVPSQSCMYFRILTYWIRNNSWFPGSTANGPMACCCYRGSYGSLNTKAGGSGSGWGVKCNNWNNGSGYGEDWRSSRFLVYEQQRPKISPAAIFSQSTCCFASCTSKAGASRRIRASCVKSSSITTWFFNGTWLLWSWNSHEIRTHHFILYCSPILVFWTSTWSIRHSTTRLLELYLWHFTHYLYIW